MTLEEEKELLQRDSKTLAVMIIANRVLGGNKTETKKCMIALMKRRLDGDKFEFENFIEDCVKEYKIDINLDLFEDIRKELMKSLADNIVKSFTN